MIIYAPHNENLLKERIIQAEKILNQIPAKYCFITGSFLYKEKYNDIDVFVISRTKKEIKIKNKKVKITIIDFNDLYSLFCHSVSKSCIAKNILSTRQLKVTFSDYWNVINEAIPTLMNEKDKFNKNVRFLILYTEYFRTGKVLDTYELAEKISQFKDYKEILDYVKNELVEIIRKGMKLSYAKRFFYTQAGHYKDLREYDAQNFLYGLAHDAVTAHG
ncbi:MAG: hypothetical protein Q7S55_05665 [Nanoarchaeota archaeon]|nr:hypothetical protein [Nanoarchaeota archaeon]